MLKDWNKDHWSQRSFVLNNSNHQTKLRNYCKSSITTKHFIKMAGGRGARGPLPREVQVSKQMSWLLRHGAEQEGLKLDEGGFINAADVLNNRKLKSFKVTFAELQAIVADNDKQRFSLVPAAANLAVTDTGDGATQLPIPSDDPRDYLIRANQGHSLKVESEGLLAPVTAENMPEMAVHGTTHGAWPLILATGGLKPMGRTHVHFASGLPAGFKPLDDQDVKDEEAAPVISGMRKSSSVLVYLDLAKAVNAGLTFWLSDNGVILTEGDEEGLVKTEFFYKVEDRTGEGVLMQDGRVVKEVPEKWASKGSGRGGRGGRGGWGRGLGRGG